MKIENISQAFVNLNSDFLSITSNLEIQIKTEIEKSTGCKVSFWYYKEQLNWKVISHEDKRVVAKIEQSGVVTLIFQKKLSNIEKTSLDTSQDFLEVNFLEASKEDIFQLIQFNQLSEMIKKIEKYLFNM